MVSRSAVRLPSGEAPAAVLPVDRLLRHTERYGDLLPHDALIAGPADEGRLAAFDLVASFPDRGQFAQHAVGPGGFLIERRPHAVNVC